MLDADSSGTVGFDDFFEFVRGRKHSLDSRWRSQPIAMELRVEVPSQHDPLTGEERRPTLDELAWDSSMGPETLRALVKEMLERRHLGPTDLLKAWDTQPTSRTASEHHKLNRDEFCSHLAELFIRSEGAQCSSDDVFDLWENEVAAVANRAFDIVRGATAQGGRPSYGLHTPSIDIIRLEQWLDEPRRSASLPLKTEAERRKQARRRQRAQARDEQNVPHGRVAERALDRSERAARASTGIAVAFAKAKHIKDAKEFALRRRWEEANAWSSDWGANARSGRIKLPRLQHLETPIGLVKPMTINERWKLRQDKLIGAAQDCKATMVISRSSVSLPAHVSSSHRETQIHSMNVLPLIRTGGSAERFYETRCARDR